jgi:potassium-transporting ATPase KdpC subunit
MKEILGTLRPALLLVLAFTVIGGLLYPALVTGAAQVALPRQANGSLVTAGGTVVGSELIGQPFTDPAYFWSRPSAVGPFPYNAMTSSGTNQGPLNPALADAAGARIAALRDADPGNTAPVPVDLVTASGSGLDPDISPAAAYYQVARVARLRGKSPDEIRALVDQHVQERTLGVLGERRVNAVALNRDLDAAAPRGRALDVVAGAPKGPAQ